MNKKNLLINLTISAITLLLCFAAAELLTRTFGHYDTNGNFVSNFYGTLRPESMPVTSNQQNLSEYLAHEAESFVQYDPTLGWKPRPNSHSADGLYHYNAAGIRTSPARPEYTLHPPPDTYRIALFGDSYTHGDEVPFTESWGHQLAERLTEAGLPVEVINFGVGGYGMDQALLRWQTFGAAYQPHLVIFGLQMENVKRNVNLFRPLYRSGTGIPFTKPRFILVEGQQLQLINQPTMPLAEIPELTANFAAWELAQFDYFFEPRKYQQEWWLNSHFLALLDKAWTEYHTPSFSYDPTAEAGQLTQAIVAQFATEVKATGAEFLIVHMPREHDLQDLAAGKPLRYAALLTAIEQQHGLLYPEQGRLAQAEGLSFSPLYAGDHYSAMGGAIIAEAITEHLIMQNYVKRR